MWIGVGEGQDNFCQLSLHNVVWGSDCHAALPSMAVVAGCRYSSSFGLVCSMTLLWRSTTVGMQQQQLLLPLVLLRVRHWAIQVHCRYFSVSVPQQGLAWFILREERKRVISQEYTKQKKKYKAKTQRHTIKRYRMTFEGGR